MEKPILVVFDFDETLINRDSLLDFQRFSCTRYEFFRKAFLLIPTMLRFKARLIDNTAAKQALLRIFWEGASEDLFQRQCKAYAKHLDAIVNPDAITCLKKHQQAGHTTIIVSASVEDWIRPWATEQGVKEIIASKLERRDGLLTGNLDGSNCFGPEKVNRLLQIYPKRTAYHLYVYGDGKSDLELFKFADRVYQNEFTFEES